MRHIPVMLAVGVMLAAAPAALALDAAAHAECAGGTHVVTVSGLYIEEFDGEIIDGEISGIVFECEAVGVCEPSFFYPETPLPFDPQPSDQGWPMYEAEVSIDPPLAGVTYRYTPYGVRPDGSLVPTMHNCDADARSYALASCTDVPMARGTLVIDSTYGEEIYFRIDSCEANCWTEDVWAMLNQDLVEELSGQSWGSLLGRVVDVFGTRTYCSMPGGDHHAITRIAPAADGDCGPVPTERESWGGLKAMYR